MTATARTNATSFCCAQPRTSARHVPPLIRGCAQFSGVGCVRANRTPLRRAGSVYAMVLGVSMLIAVIGIAALATARVTTRTASASNDWVEAGVTAFSAAEHAIARINAAAAASPTSWRNGFTSGAVGFSASFGRGTMKWVLVDGKGLPSDDGVLNDDYADAITVYGIGRIGETTRVYSVTLDAGGGGLDVLRCPLHAGGDLEIEGVTYATGGPVSTNADYDTDHPAYLRGGTSGAGAAEAAGSGYAIVSPAKRMPAAGVFDTYKAMATPIVPSGSFSTPLVLTAAHNPFGTPNDKGIYYFRVPDNASTVTIPSALIRGTLLVEAVNASGGLTLVIDGPTSWEPHDRKYAALLTRGIRKVTIEGSMDFLSYGGTTYPSELNGVIHLIGTTDVNVDAPAFVRGCLIADGRVYVGDPANGRAVGLIADPALLTRPPIGYVKGTVMTPSPGSWDWPSPPAAALSAPVDAD